MIERKNIDVLNEMSWKELLFWMQLNLERANVYWETPCMMHVLCVKNVYQRHRKFLGDCEECITKYLKEGVYNETR